MTNEEIAKRKARALEMDRRRQETAAKWLCKYDRHGIKYSRPGE